MRHGGAPGGHDGQSRRSEPYACWRCGHDLPFALFPLTRLARCPECRADLRVCRLCRFHDRSRLNQCAHERADPPADRTLANYCTWFRPRRGAHAGAQSAEAAAAEARLSALFGDADTEDAAAGDAGAGDLPGDAATAEPRDEAARAREALEALFSTSPSDRSQED